MRHLITSSSRMRDCPEHIETLLLVFIEIASGCPALREGWSWKNVPVPVRVYL